MGYLFENFSGIDIAGDRQRLAEARQELAEARKEVVDARQEATHAIENFVRYQLSLRTERKEIEVLLQKIFQKEESEAVSIMDRLIS